MYADYFETNPAKPHSAFTRHILSRVNGLEEFLNVNAADGDTYDIAPAVDKVEGKPGIILTHTDAQGRAESFEAALCARKLADGLYDIGLWFTQENEGFVLSSANEHYYPDESWQFLTEQAAGLRGMIAEAVDQRRKDKEPRLAYDFELKARNPDHLYADPADRIARPQPRQPGLWEAIKETAARTARRYASHPA